MAAPAERFLEAHPDAASVWYPPLSRAVGRVLTLPGLRRFSPLARRIDAIAQPAGRITLLDAPRRADGTRGGRMTVLSANLWHDWPRQHRWSERLAAVADLVESEEVDVVLLQEVARTADLHADLWLADRLGMSLAYARANGDCAAIGFEEGVVVLSTFPIRDVHLRQLGRSHNPLARRVALGAILTTPGGPLLAVSAHLGLVGRTNAAQIRELRSWVDEVGGDAIALVGGDFNATEGAAEIVRTSALWTDTFRDRHPEGSATTHYSTAPWRALRRHRRLDYVFLHQPGTQDWQVLSAGHVDAAGGPHSDHRAVLVHLDTG